MTNKMHDKSLAGQVLFITLIMVAIGAVMVFSASSITADYKNNTMLYYFLKQTVWILIGGLFFLFFALLDYNKLMKNVDWIMYGTFLALVIVMFVAPRINGARRWIRLGPLSVQPAEFAKLAVLVFLASYIQKNKNRMRDLTDGLIMPLLVVTPILALIVFEKDLGIPAVIFVTAIVVLFAGGIRHSYVFYALAGGLACASLYVLVYPHAIQRLFVFLNPWAVQDSAGYQIIQSLAALGSGGPWGRGLGASKVKMLFLPDSHTDFIFAIIGEELGLWGTLMMVGLFIWLFVVGIKISLNARNMFGCLLAFGIAVMVAFQAIFNIGVSVALLPHKGLPLPFISFGGSSLIVTLSCMGILLNISHQTEK
jgi:cell division protein FtsW